MPGRIECYIHSDNATKNKAAAMVKVTCETDFAAKTEEFIDFCHLVARHACGYQVSDPAEILSSSAEVAIPIVQSLKELEGCIKEKVSIAAISLMRL